MVGKRVYFGKIGAINASLIAGNEPENRLERLEEFWRRMRRKEFWGLSHWPGLADTTSYWSTVLGGIPRSGRREVVDEISEHIVEGRAELDEQTEAEIRNLLDRVGDPRDIAAEARATGRM